MIFLITLLIGTCLTFQGDFTDCYSCSQKDEGKRFICNWGDLMKDKKNMIACCVKGSKSRYCWDNEYSNCSQTFGQTDGLFFRYCTSVSDKDVCGEEALVPQTQKAVVTSKPLVWSESQQRFDACSHTIKKADNFTHAVGFNSVKFTELVNVDVTINWFWNVDKLDDPGKVVDEGAVVKVGETYNVTNRQNLIFSIKVKEKDIEAKYAFEYWTDAPDATMIDQFVTWFEELSTTMLLVIIICFALCLVLYCGCIFLCCKKCCCKRKISPEDEDTIMGTPKNGGGPKLS